MNDTINEKGQPVMFNPWIFCDDNYPENLPTARGSYFLFDFFCNVSENLHKNT